MKLGGGLGEKNEVDFDYIFCIGGDGTLLRLLRILFMMQKQGMPRIISMSMGSKNYLCNFNVLESRLILESTALNYDQSAISDKLQIDYRSCLKCYFQTKDQN
jgi:NAD kinase